MTFPRQKAQPLHLHRVQWVDVNILLQKLSHFSISLSSGPFLSHGTPSLQKLHALHLQCWQ